MNHFSTTKKERNLYSIPLFQEFNDVIQFYLIIVFIDIGVKFYFLQFPDHLFLPLIPDLLIFLIDEFAEIHNSTNHWIGVRRYQNEILTGFPGSFNRFGKRDNAKLRIVRINQPNIGIL